MASSPSTFPFLFSTTEPAYPPTAAFPLPPYGCGAPTYGHNPFPILTAPSPFPAAATYPPPLPLGGYSTSHPPFFYGAVFPAPASGFPPNWPTWPPPAISPTPSTAPSTFSSATTSSIPPASGSSPAPPNASAFPSSYPTREVSLPTQADPNRPPVSSSLSPVRWASTLSELPDADFSFPTQACSSTTKVGNTTLRDGGVLLTEKSSSAIHPAKPVTCKDGGLTKGSNTRGASIYGVHKHTGLGTLSMFNASPNHRLFMDDDAAVQAAADERVPAKNAIRHRRQRELLNLQARLDQQQERERNSFETIQDGLVKLRSMASQLAVAIGMQTTKVLATESSPTVAFALYTSPATTALRSSDTGAAESSTVNSLGASFAFPTLASSSTVPAAPAYVAPKVLGEMPQCYGLHNLNCHSVLRADGTEHSYYALPDIDPLDTATREPVFNIYDDETNDSSNDLVDVFAGIPEQQDCEEKKHKGEQAPKCFSNPSENRLPPAVSEFTLQDISDVSVPRYIKFRHSQWIQEISGDVKHLNVYKWTMSLMEEGREDWDPGILNTIMKISPVVNWSSLKGSPHAVIFSPSILLSMIIYAATSIPNIVVSLPLPVLWDPGGTKFPIMFMTATDVTKLQSTYVYSTKIVHVFAVDFRARGAPIFAYARTCYLAFDSRWTEAVLVLAVPCSKGKPVAKHVIFLSNGGCSMTNHCFPQLLMQSLCAASTVQVTKQMHHLEFILMSDILQNGSKFRDGQLAYMPQGASINPSEWARYMVTVCLVGHLYLKRPSYNGTLELLLSISKVFRRIAMQRI